MSDDASPRLGLPYLAAAQAQKHVTLNAALAALDGLVACAIESRSTAVQPGAPADGALYLVATGATGADWALFPAGGLLRFEAGAWERLTAAPGQLAYVRDEDRLIVRDAAGAWRSVGELIGALAGLSALGVGTTADAGNPLSVRGPAALFTGSTAGFQVKLNKTAAADTASLLYQTDYSGRAEVGLCGDDKLHVKVSPDGSAWAEAVVVDGAGRTGLGVSAPTSRLQVDGAVRVRAYAKSALPGAGSEGAGAMIYVSDESAGSTLAFSDGASWRRVHDRAVVS